MSDHQMNVSEHQQPVHLVWDVPLRLFHWLLVMCVIGGIVTGKMEALDWHEHFGMAVMGLVAFRVIWGFTGSQTARFHRFLKWPKQVLDNISDMRQKKASNLSGHSALGGYATLVLLFVVALMSVSGSFSSDDVLYEGPFVHLMPSLSPIAESVHEITEKFLFLVIFLHLLALGLYFFRLKKNLVPAMITGKRAGAQGDSGTLSVPQMLYGLILLIGCLTVFQAAIFLRPSFF